MHGDPSFLQDEHHSPLRYSDPTLPYVDALVSFSSLMCFMSIRMASIFEDFIWDMQCMQMKNVGNVSMNGI